MHNKFSNFTQFRQPIVGKVNLNGKYSNVRFIGIADVEGKSTCYLTSNGDGSQTWTSLEDVIVTDTAYLPLSQSALAHIGSSDSQPARTRS
jgi:hypothetical protein